MKGDRKASKPRKPGTSSHSQWDRDLACKPLRTSSNSCTAAQLQIYADLQGREELGELAHGARGRMSSTPMARSMPFHPPISSEILKSLFVPPRHRRQRRRRRCSSKQELPLGPNRLPGPQEPARHDSALSLPDDNAAAPVNCWRRCSRCASGRLSSANTRDLQIDPSAGHDFI